LRLNLSMSKFCAAGLPTASLLLPKFCNYQNSGQFHNQPLGKIGHQVYMNAVSCLTRHDESGCAAFPEKGCRCFMRDEGTLYVRYLRFRCGKVHHCKSIIINILVWILAAVADLKISFLHAFAL
jgi:hypothetical protein